MDENTYKEPVKEPSSNKESKGNSVFQSMLNGSYLTFEKSPGLFPFVIFLTFLSVLLIANTYYAEKKVRQIEAMRNEVTELRIIYISNKAELMHLSNQSEIARRLASKGYIESTVPPRIVQEEKRQRSFLLRIFRGRH